MNTLITAVSPSWCHFSAFRYQATGLCSSQAPVFQKLWLTPAGDSHCMVPAWQSIAFKVVVNSAGIGVTSWQGNLRLLVPLLVTGLKIWHLRPTSNFFPKNNFFNALATGSCSHWRCWLVASTERKWNNFSFWRDWLQRRPSHFSWKMQIQGILSQFVEQSLLRTLRKVFQWPWTSM